MRRQYRASRSFWLLGVALTTVAALACSDDVRTPDRGRPRNQAGTDNGDAPPQAGMPASDKPGAGAPAWGGQTTTPPGRGAGESSGGNDAGASSGGSDGGQFMRAGSAGQASTPGAGTSGVPVGGDAGAAGQASDSAGQAGTSSQPQEPVAGELCGACGATRCAAVSKSCGANPECAPWLACLKSCDSTACIDECDASHSEVARVYYDVYECLCDSCSESCAVAQACSKQCVDETPLPPMTVAPSTLAETGLYSAAGSADSPPTVAPHARFYEAKYPLWSDGATKERYIYVPRCATIDTTDMDHWSFPVGTRLWKNFSVDGQRVETRLIHRYGQGTTDWLFATYGWDASKPNDPSAAVAVLHGQPRTNGTMHDIPDPSACTACHGKLPDKPLGFSAFQLSHSGSGLTMAKLSNWGWLSVPAPQGFEPPGTPVQRAALGYLHGNCGGCHNSHGQFPRDNPMKLRLLVGQTDYELTDTVLTTVGVATLHENPELNGKPRIAAQSASDSAIYLRMSDRDDYPMPPLGTKLPDEDGGIAAILSWIEAIPK